MNQHNPTFRFCPVCGGRLKETELKEKEPPRLMCSLCGFVFYLDPKLVACSIVDLEEGIVLLKRGIGPGKGKWVIPGGFVDRGEKVEDAAIRETKEECGLRIEVPELLGVYSYPGHVPVVVVYIGGYLSGAVKAGDETAEAGLFPIERIPWKDLAFQSTLDALKDYCMLKKTKGGNSV